MIATLTDAVTLMIFFMGVATVVLSLWVARYFSTRRPHVKTPDGWRLTKALQLQLYGEAVIGFGTLLFAAATHFGYIQAWSVQFQSVLRFIMFAATSITTFHLFSVVRAITSQK